VQDGRGIALIMVLFVMFSLGMMLFSFVFMMQNEARFAVVNRNSTQALGLAEAGTQEALNRLTMFGLNVGVTPSFTNSLASTFPGSSATVTYQASVQGNPSLFPILSTATVAGAQRAVRIFVQAVYKPGMNRVIYGQKLLCEGNCAPVQSDMYSQTAILFDSSYQESQLCTPGTTPTNLVAPEVMAGTTIGAANGPALTPPCGGPPYDGAAMSFTTECASTSPYKMTEVAPTPCPGGGRAMSGADMVPYNWHPMTPIGMSSADFTTVVTAPSLPPGISVVQATQNAVGVTYTPAGTYTPSYWTSKPTTNGQVLLITATQPFCVTSTGLTLPTPAVTGSCPPGSNYYGSQSAGAPNATRFLDGGLVQDDLTRPTAQTFFQPPTCNTCKAGGPNGYQNGIRYLPILPTINVLGMACGQNVNPGTNVFDKLTAGASPCPAQTISQTNVTFSGIKGSPESLIIDNAGVGAVTLSASLAGSGGTCSTINFDNYNVGMILATGDVTLATNFTLQGFIYTPGTVTLNGSTSAFSGGILAPSVVSSNPPSTATQTSIYSTLVSCGNALSVLNPVVFNFPVISWQDRPLNKP
jgi:hypothetical protein